MNKGAKIIIGIIIVVISLIALGNGLNNIYKSKVEFDAANADLKQACHNLRQAEIEAGVPHSFKPECTKLGE